MIRAVLLEPAPCTHLVTDAACPTARKCGACGEWRCDCAADADPALSVACPTCRAPQGAECRARRGGRAGGYRPYLGHHVERRMLAAGMCLTCEGAGSVVMDGDREDCPSCQGSGRAS